MIVGQAQVVGAEVVAPLGHAVRLVDDEQRDRAAARSRCGTRGLRTARARRRRPCACAVADLRPAPAGCPRRRGEHHRGVAEVGEPRALVAHQRDQRRDDHGQVLPGERGELVAEALAAAGRHDHERVAPVERGLHRLALAGAEGGETEEREQRLGGGVGGAEAGRGGARGGRSVARSGVGRAGRARARRRSVRAIAASGREVSAGAEPRGGAARAVVFERRPERELRRLGGGVRPIGAGRVAA